MADLHDLVISSDQPLGQINGPNNTGLFTNPMALKMPALTASAFVIQDTSSNNYLSFDTRAGQGLTIAGIVPATAATGVSAGTVLSVTAPAGGNATVNAPGAGGSIALTAGNAGTGGTGNAAGGILTLKGGTASGTGVTGYVSIPTGGGGLVVQDANVVTSLANASVTAVYLTGSAPASNTHQFGLSVDTAFNPSGVNTNDGGGILTALNQPAGIQTNHAMGLKIQPPIFQSAETLNAVTLNGILIADQNPLSTFDPRAHGAGVVVTNVYGIEIQNVRNGQSANVGIMIDAVGASGNAGVIGINIGTLLGANQPIGLSINPGATVGGAQCFVANPGAYTTIVSEITHFQVSAATLNITGSYAQQRFNIFGQPTLANAGSLQTITNAATVAIFGAPTVSSPNAAATNVFGLNVCLLGTTLSNIAGTTYGAINVANHTVTLNATTTNITSTNGLAALHLGVITYTAASATVVTNAATLDIVGPPVMTGGGPASATNLNALRVQSGTSFLGGALTVSTGGIVVTGGISAPSSTAMTVGTTSAGLTLSTSTSGTLAVTSAGVLTLTGAAASVWSVASANLTVSTTTSGTLAVTSAGVLTLTGAGASTWSLSSGALIIQNASANLTLQTTTSGTLLLASAAALQINSGSGGILHQAATALPAAGAATMGLTMSSTAPIGVFAGTSAPTFSAPNGSIYLRYDGGANNHVYINTSGASSSGTTWTATIDA